MPQHGPRRNQNRLHLEENRENLSREKNVTFELEANQGIIDLIFILNKA